MPPTVRTKGLRVTVPALCFCGQPAVNRGTYYCSSECAREDALKSLILGKPHESSSKLPPLPTLPPGFFDLPPKRGGPTNAILSLDNDDDDHLYDFASLSLTGKGMTGKGMTDHGPFQTMARSPPRSKGDPATSDPSVPRSITSSMSSTPSKRSKWQSHYQREQARESIDKSSMDIPFFLVDEAEENLLETQEIEAPPREEGKLLSPSSAVTTAPKVESSLQRTGSFGLLSSEMPPFTCKEGVSLPRHRSNTASSCGNSTSHQRSSSSSYNSLVTTNASRSSYTSPDTSPTKSEYEAPPKDFIPTRPKYGSAFGNTEESSICGPVVQLSVDVTDSMLASRRRRKSSEDGTLRAEKVLDSEHQDHLQESQKDALDESPLVATAIAPSDESPKPIVPPSEKATPHIPNTKGGIPVSKSQWPLFGLPPGRETVSRLPIAPLPSVSRPLHVSSSMMHPNLEIQSPQPHPLTGTVVKKTVMTTKTRLPIGSTTNTSHPPIPRSKTPSNTPSSGLSVSLHGNTFQAPAYAMGTLKISASARILRTSASQSSLKAKREIHIPDTGKVEVKQLITTAPIPVREEEEVEGAKRDEAVPEADQKSVSQKKERDSIKSALAGSYFKLYGTPRSKRETQRVQNSSTLSLPEKTSRTSRLPLKLDFNALRGKSDNSDITPKPSPSVLKYPLSGSERGLATPGGPLTPRVDSERNPMMVLTPLMDNAHSFRSLSNLRSPPLGPDLTYTRSLGCGPSSQSLVSYSSVEEEIPTLHMAHKMHLSTAPPPAVRSSFWDTKFKQ